MTHQSLEQYLPHSVVANHDVQENPGPKVKVLNTRSFHSSMKPTAAAAATPLYLRRFALALRPYSALQFLKRLIKHPVIHPPQRPQQLPSKTLNPKTMSKDPKAKAKPDTRPAC